MNEIERQKKFEADALQDGILRYCQSREYAMATDSRPVRGLVASSLQPLAEAILQEQLALKVPGSQKLPRYGTPLLSINHEKLALIALGTLLNTVSKSEFEEGVAPAVTAVAYEIGQRCRLERIFDCLRNRQVDVARELRSRNRSGHAGRRAEELARELDDDDEWAKTYRAHHLGEKLIALAVRFAKFEGKPLFELQTVRESQAQLTKTTQRIALTAAADAWIADRDTTLASLTPIYLPMIVPPRPWTSLSGGGYLATPLKLLKRQPMATARRLFEKADLALVFKAVNAMQNTSYRINKDIYRNMRAARDEGHPFFGMPSRAVEQKGLRKIIDLRLSLSQRFLNEPRFYFPHQLDHRGRAYPVPQLVHPQSDHIGRSLLEFAEGKPLGKRGAYWLAIHLANCYWKGNKVAFDKRLRWVNEHEAEIVDFAANPIRPHRFWHKADKPWTFLAACLEWKRYREQGANLHSHLPVSMDGSCNGYQHLSAMGLDPIGGSATNLVPSDQPEDIYQEVADHVSFRIMFEAESAVSPNRDIARELLGKIDRSVVKHATMTTPYGVTWQTIYRQLLEAKPAKDCRDPKKSARYLAELLEVCIPEVAVEAGNIMEWLRDVARYLAKANRGMAWTTPAGFPVIHENREPKTTARRHRGSHFRSL